MKYSSLLVLLALAVVSSACAKGEPAHPTVGILSDLSTPSGISLEQKSGYDVGLGVPGVELAVNEIDESTSQGDIQRTVRGMVQSSETPLVAVLGGTSNSATSHAAALANFFNVPMIVPTANGDNLFPSNNQWAFRLSAPGAAYASYFFGSILNKQSVDDVTITSETALSDPELKVAILYEANTFGESAAVAAAEAAMAQSIKIMVYGRFEPQNADPAQLQVLAEKVQESGVQLVYLISSDPAMTRSVVQTFRATLDERSMPVLLGQAGGFTAQEFLISKEAEGVYVLRQQIDRTQCPAEIQSSYQAQTYAATYLLAQVIQDANDNLAGADKQFSLIRQPDSAIQAQREAIRDVLKQVNMDVPCVGKVAFDNTGQNKLLRLEMVHVVNGSTEFITTIDFLGVLKSRIAEDLFE